MRIYILMGILVLGMALFGTMTGYWVTLFRNSSKRKGLIYGGVLGLALAVGTIVLQRLMYSIHGGMMMDLVRPVLIGLNGLVVALFSTFAVLTIFGCILRTYAFRGSL